MLYAYMRVSTPHQTIENQHYELLKFADQQALRIDAWITETVSGARTYRGSRSNGYRWRIP
jgi:DNA invertase Pin-like site-specific DNA recombinase